MNTVSYTMDTLYFTWFDKPVDIEPNLQLPQFALRGYVQNDCSQNYTAGQSIHLYSSTTLAVKKVKKGIAVCRQACHHRYGNSHAI